jgi:hypothetical protein
MGSARARRRSRGLRSASSSRRTSPYKTRQVTIAIRMSNTFSNLLISVIKANVFEEHEQINVQISSQSSRQPTSIPDMLPPRRLTNASKDLPTSSGHMDKSSLC